MGLVPENGVYFHGERAASFRFVLVDPSIGKGVAQGAEKHRQRGAGSLSCPNLGLKGIGERCPVFQGAAKSLAGGEKAKRGKARATSFAQTGGDRT